MVGKGRTLCRFALLHWPWLRARFLPTRRPEKLILFSVWGFFFLFFQPNGDGGIWQRRALPLSFSISKIGQPGVNQHPSPILSPRSAMRVLGLSGTNSLWLSPVDDCQFRVDHAGLRFFFLPSCGNCRIKITTIQIAESYSALAFLASSKIPRALPVFTVWFTGLFFLFSPACHRLRVSVAGSHTGGIRAIAHKHGFVDGIDSITSMGSATPSPS